MSCCVAACFQFNRNITESRRRQFTSSYSKNPLRINVWWLALKLTASRSTSTVFCPKIFWSVIRNAFRDCVSNWKCWNSARAKNGSEDPATHGPYMVRATPYASNSQSSKTAVNEGNAIGKRRMKDDLTEAVNIQNQLEMCCGGWLGWKNARRCGLNLLKYALALSREYSLLLFTSAPTLKTPPAGRHALESDNNGYLWNILLQEFALCVKSNNYREAADFHLSLSSIFANCQYHQKMLHNPRDSRS